MRGFLRLDNETIGEFEASVVDEGMGVIGGDLNVHPAYEKYRKRFQALYGQKGNANSDDFNFEVILDDGTIVRTQGGVSVTDAPEFGERLVDAAGIDYKIIERVKAARPIAAPPSPSTPT
jgi:hypothetical protein